MRLNRFYITSEELKNRYIKNNDTYHAISVLRLKEGDTISLFIDDAFDYLAEIMLITKFGINFEILKQNKNTSNPKLPITFFQALAKGDKLELITQKATELGTSQLIPFYSKNCDVKPNTTKADRLTKIMINACRQCGRSKLMQIETILKFDGVLNTLKNYDIVLFANETQNKNYILNVLNKKSSAKNIAIIVGPEGGFAPDEITALLNLKNVQSVSLGRRILRTETAGLYMLSVISEVTQN